MQLFSHPVSPDYPNGKPLIDHLRRVTDLAFQKYKGPKEYKRYLKLIGLIHDIGKLNPNFQEYLFSKEKEGFTKFKDHSYISAIILLYLVAINQKSLNDEENSILALCAVLVAKHHGNLPDVHENPLSEIALEPIKRFIEGDAITFKEFIERSNELLEVLREDLFLKDLFIDEVKLKNVVIHANELIEQILNKVPVEKKLELLQVCQYMFSCLIEGDKRDAGDNHKINCEDIDQRISVDFFNDSLKQFYQRYKSDSPLNELRTAINTTCVEEVRNQISQGERVFQIVSPTGSGKTLTFLSVANEIKKAKQDANYKVIYAIPFLSITDQVTQICEHIFDAKKDLIYRIDSGAEAKQSEQKNESDIEETRREAMRAFAENIFDHDFIITTFVKLFETLLANTNKTLLRLNNLSQSIILVDEIQSLPPRNYTALMALLSNFAYLFDCYIVVGSATQPSFELPESQGSQLIKGKAISEFMRSDLFKGYKLPINLLNDFEDVYKNPIFNRYKILVNLKEQSLDQLVQDALNLNQSLLIVLNTKNASLEVFRTLNKKLKHQNIYLINTLQTLRDRRKKLKLIKDKLGAGEKVILVSTQLIEAGVDISFPIVFRDFAPIPSVIQVAGRCNRNSELAQGEVRLYNLVDSEKKSYCEKVYDISLLKTTSVVLGDITTINENELLRHQKEYFDLLNQNLRFGEYTTFDGKICYVDSAVNSFEYKKLGQFKLIPKDAETISFFIIKGESDQQDWNEFQAVVNSKSGFDSKTKIEKIRRKISDREVQVRFLLNDPKLIEYKTLSYLGVVPSNASVNRNYTFEEGLSDELVQESLNII